MTVCDLAQSWSSLWLPPKRLTLSEWSEQHLVLSSEYSSRSGPIKLYQFQKEIFDAFTDPAVRELVVMSSTQMVKTILLQAVIAYTIAVEPLPILVIQPKDDAAKKFSKRRIAPMLRDCEALRDLVSDSGPGKEGTIQEKTFPGGTLSIVGAGSPTNLASASIAILLSDEVDKFEINVGNHGDPIMQAKARLSTYGSRAKIVTVCSPTDEHTSRIARDYRASDQRQAYVPCPLCGHYQTLRFGQVRWDNSLALEKRAATAYYQCEACDAQWSDLDRWRACEALEWRANKPFAGIAGFHVSHIYSPWHKLSDIVTEFLRTQQNWSERKTFINNTLAELWKTEGISPDEDRIFARREDFPFGDDAVVPARACFLTASVDVQQDRLEVEVRAWGRGKESWSVAYEVIQPLAADGRTPLPTTDPQVWDELNRRILQRDWKHESGGTLPIALMAIDVGHNAQTVYEFCLKHPQPIYSPTVGMRVRAMRSVVPVRGGDDELKIIQTISNENAARKRQDIRIVTIGTHCVKSELYDILRNVRPNGSDPVPNCIHFPQFDKPYFVGLCSEHRIVKPNGTHAWEKKPNARNEPLDLAVYNRAAATMVGIDAFNDGHWAQWEASVKRVVDPSAPISNAPPPQATPQRQVRGRFI